MHTAEVVKREVEGHGCDVILSLSAERVCQTSKLRMELGRVAAVLAGRGPWSEARTA